VEPCGAAGDCASALTGGATGLVADDVLPVEVGAEVALVGGVGGAFTGGVPGSAGGALTVGGCELPQAARPTPIETTAAPWVSCASLWSLEDLIGPRLNTGATIRHQRPSSTERTVSSIDSRGVNPKT
jgi:hypothetical protein